MARLLDYPRRRPSGDDRPAERSRRLQEARAAWSDKVSHISAFPLSFDSLSLLGRHGRRLRSSARGAGARAQGADTLDNHGLHLPSRSLSLEPARADPPLARTEFILKLVFSVVFVLLGGVFSGLSLGLMGRSQSLASSRLCRQRADLFPCRPRLDEPARWARQHCWP